MNTFYLNDNESLPRHTVATIGFFDGVHLGHQHLIKMVMDAARAQGTESMVITFAKHPRQVLDESFQPLFLTFPDEKMIRLSQSGVDNCVVLPFDREMACMTAREFMERVLRDRLGVTTLVMGYDNRFGHDRTEGIDDYIRYGQEMGMEVFRNQSYVLNGIHISSSVVRNYIRQGEIEIANQCLGYPYTIAGIVRGGEQEGRKMGFPTANLDTSAFGQLIPPSGVYAVRARLMQTMATKPAMMNIGHRPTFGGLEMTVETHIFNFNEDIYGKLLLVSIECKIREERKFDTVEALQEQLQIDRDLILKKFELEKDNDF